MEHGSDTGGDVEALGWLEERSVTQITTQQPAGKKVINSLTYFQEMLWSSDQNQE